QSLLFQYSVLEVISPVRSLHSAGLDLFYFTYAAPTEIYTLSLHDALPISCDDSPQREYLAQDRHDQDARRSCSCRKSVCQYRGRDRKSTRLNSSHVKISYAVFCLKKKRHKQYKERKGRDP